MQLSCATELRNSTWSATLLITQLSCVKIVIRKNHMTWTESKLTHRANRVEQIAQLGSHLLKGVHNTGLVDLDPKKPDVIACVERTGSRFQERLLNNPMDHINRSPQDFVQTCRDLYTQDEQGNPTSSFSVLLLAEDPLHFDASRSLRVGQSTKQPQQFFGEATVVRRKAGEGRFVYTLKIRVIGARVNQLLRDDLQGLSLASAVTSRKTIREVATSNFQAGCSGSNIKGISDFAHLGTVLPTLDELNSGRNSGIVRSVTQATGKQPHTIADLAHIHGLKDQAATGLGKDLVNSSTALNFLQNDPRAEDIFIVDPRLTQQVVIIPFWDELRDFETEQIDESSVVLASVALGALTTFGESGMDQIALAVESSNRGNKVPLSRFTAFNNVR